MSVYSHGICASELGLKEKPSQHWQNDSIHFVPWHNVEDHGLKNQEAICFVRCSANGSSQIKYYVCVRESHSWTKEAMVS